ncbi:ATP-dependent DNA ligase [Candidatus Woesearchaeota archaeon]|nr:ATP-dependent DNA ligase [Candidatus Woesearchaeota archaeon]
MLYKDLAQVYAKLESTPKRLDKTYHVSQVLKKSGMQDIKQTILLLQGKVFPSWDSTKIGVASKLILKAISISTGIQIEQVEDRWKIRGDLGLVAEELVKKKRQATLFQKELTVLKVFSNLRKLSSVEGSGSVDIKVKLIAELLTSATPLEARYIVRTVLQELRVGVGDGSIRDAIVWAYMPKAVGIFHRCEKCDKWMPNTPRCLECGNELDTKFDISKEKGETEKKIIKIKSKDELEDADLDEKEFIITPDEQTARDVYNALVCFVEEAHSVSNDYALVAKVAMSEGIQSLKNIVLQAGTPIKVMLAQKTSDVETGFSRAGSPAVLEYKYDGFRMQIHKSEGGVEIFTRRLENVTKQFKEVAELVEKHIDSESYILDCEAVGYDPKTKKYLPFQSISQRIKRKHNIEEMAKKFPVELNIFDLIFADGKSFIKYPFLERRKRLEKIFKNPAERRIKLAEQLVTSDIKEAERFYHSSLDAGNEGIMIKKIDAIYQPGSRVEGWLKLKPVMESLDVVVVGAEWGEGKRSGWFTSFSIAVTDENGNFLEIGKVGTGFKEKEDEEGVTFNQMTELLRPLVISEKGRSVQVQPQIVIEINYEEIQKSPTYSSGYALRFPRIVRLRDDRAPDEASTIDMIKEFYRSQNK